MRRLYSLILAAVLFLAACGPASRETGEVSATQPASRCGNGVCESGENMNSCSQDCAAGLSNATIKTTYIKSDGSTGRIAVMIASPRVKRYTEGAGVVVVTPSIFIAENGFRKDPDLTSLGLIQVSFLWPGGKDEASQTASGGEFDHGGPNSIMILRDVLRFAGGRMADVNGRYIFGLASTPPLIDEVGVYAFGDAGLPVVKALALYGDQYQGLQYFVGREIAPTDTLASGEVGYYDAAGKAVENPLYTYPASYSFNGLTLNYTNLRWDPAYTSGLSTLAGRPYLDLDGNGGISAGDYVFDGSVPVIGGKRYYSKKLTQALLDNGALSASAWSANVATPPEAAALWDFLTGPDRFAVMQDDPIIHNLKVMLVFAQEDHAQVAQDKPHIHQAYQGFRFEARLWVRLNPDRVYVDEMIQASAQAGREAPNATAEAVSSMDFPDNPANTQPADWTRINDYAYPPAGKADKWVPLAAVAEMADRAHSGIWDENLGQPIYHYAAATPTP